MALLDRDRPSSEAKRPLDEGGADSERRGRADKERERRERKDENDQSAEKPRGSRFSLDTLRRHPWITAAVIVVLVVVLLAALLWWLHARHYESTDDAFIDTRAVSISSQVAGSIVSVPVTDNELVAAGSPLLLIDSRDYQAAVNTAQAKLDEAQASVTTLGAQIDAQQANIDQAEKQVTAARAALQYSQQQQKRAQDLLAKGAGTEQAAQQTRSDLTQKEAALAGAEANATVAHKQIGVLNAQRQGAIAQVEEARASLTQAQTNFDRTTIRAPENGRVAKLTAAKGAYAQAGQVQMTFVPRMVWVTANFKESQLADMRAGQPVDIEVDAYPGKSFHGHIDSIQPGSGTVFSLLPAENATGNYVKIVQRVPVKIVFDNPPDVFLGPGMSVVPSARVR